MERQKANSYPAAPADGCIFAQMRGYENAVSEPTRGEEKSMPCFMPLSRPEARRLLHLQVEVHRLVRFDENIRRRTSRGAAHCDRSRWAEVGHEHGWKPSALLPLSEPARTRPHRVRRERPGNAGDVPLESSGRRAPAVRGEGPVRRAAIAAASRKVADGLQAESENC